MINKLSLSRSLILVSCVLLLGFRSFAQTIMTGNHRMEPLEVDEGLALKPVDPLIKIFPETNIFSDPTEMVSDVPRGGYATFQFAFRSTGFVNVEGLTVTQKSAGFSLFNLTNVKTGFVDYVRLGERMSDPPYDDLKSPSGFYPDPIIDTTSIAVRANYTQPVWVTVAIPQNTPAGDYAGEISLRVVKSGREFILKRPLKIKVYPVTVDKITMNQATWIHYHLPYYEQYYNARLLKLMNNGRDVPYCSSVYWDLMKVLAEKLAEYKYNVIKLAPLRLAQYKKKGDRYEINFDHFDRMVEIFRQAGALRKIDGSHFARRLGDFQSNFGVDVPIIKKDTTYFKTIPLANDTARIFYKQFLPALMTHLKQKGWNKIYMQSIGDEPTDSNYKSYVEIANFYKQYAPDVPIMEAIMTHKLPPNMVNVVVPILSVLDNNYDFFKGLQKQGAELWTYVATNPQGNYANRFIELPLIKIRLLQWIAFKYGATGFLHYGFNFWNDTPFEETDQTWHDWPGGDGYVVYPGYHKLYSSIRLEEHRNGVIDYELFKKLAAKNPEKAKELVNKIIIDFKTYDTNIKDFRMAYRELLEELSKK